jgi:hypothetical protein
MTIYQHATNERGKAIADALGQFGDEACSTPSGPRMARPSIEKARKSSKTTDLPVERATGIEPA